MDLLVNCSSAMGQAQSLENMTAKLSDFKEQVGTVATNLSFKVKAREQIGKRLNNTAKDVEENALKMTSMGSGLISAMEPAVIPGLTRDPQNSANIKGIAGRSPQ